MVLVFCCASIFFIAFRRLVCDFFGSWDLDSGSRLFGCPSLLVFPSPPHHQIPATSSNVALYYLQTESAVEVFELKKES